DDPPPEPEPPGHAGTPAIRVELRAAAVTSESSGEADISVWLATRPTADVRIPVASSDPTEGRVWVRELLFTPESFDRPQPVRATGVDDDMADGDQPYRIVFAPASSDDAAYHGLDAEDVELVNHDDESAGVSVLFGYDLRTSERGGDAFFDVVLRTRPRGDVRIPIASSDATEGRVWMLHLLFTPESWSTPQRVIVSGLDDPSNDGPQLYRIVLGACESDDAAYAGIDPMDVALTNEDDEAATVRIWPHGPLHTSERGGTAFFLVSLSTEPSAPVTIPISSEDDDEGTVSPSTLIFLPETWAEPQTVTVTGADDAVVDGDRSFRVHTGPALSDDPTYAGLEGADVEITNRDDDGAGIALSAADTMMTTEGGATATFTLVLTTEPSADVIIPLGTSDESEAIVEPASVTFTPLDWSLPQTIRIRGVDDDEADGTQMTTILTHAAQSDDLRYAGFDAADVRIGTMDDDVAGLHVVRPASPILAETGGVATFSVALTSRPKSTVTIALEVSDPTQAVCSAAELVFTPATWNVPQTFDVSAIDDDHDDGDAEVWLRFLPATGDEGYEGMDAADRMLVVADDDETT
ncbi:MAG: hypothetical protein IT379_34390, partial [Deltaproteobacteria bacterium]|nr:hypothetical protein [Deltaproteobacteria bacterium]